MYFWTLFVSSTETRMSGATQLSTYGAQRLSYLIGRSLVKINEEDQLVVHDQLRDLGRKMVEEESLDFPGERSRLWDVAVANEAFASKKVNNFRMSRSSKSFDFQVFTY